jgi:hypothetical protein
VATGPWASLPERLVTDTLDELMNQSAATIAAQRPPIPNIGVVAPRFGYRQNAFRIQDVVRLDQMYPNSKADPLSVNPGYSGSSVPSFAGF